MIACETHGGSNITLVCEHLRRAVLQKEPLPPRTTYSIELDRELMLNQIFCVTCVRERGLPQPPRPLDADHWDASPGATYEIEPVCERCYAEREGSVR